MHGDRAIGKGPMIDQHHGRGAFRIVFGRDMHEIRPIDAIHFDGALGVARTQRLTGHGQKRHPLQTIVEHRVSPARLLLVPENDPPSRLPDRSIIPQPASTDLARWRPTTGLNSLSSQVANCVITFVVEVYSDFGSEYWRMSVLPGRIARFYDAHRSRSSADSLDARSADRPRVGGHTGSGRL